jgi:LuxR family maltose regulon positive regulatory protein
MSLLTTKLYIPPVRPRERVVARPRLIERLNAGLDRKLTLVSAPAGFGKTTLLSEWIDRTGGGTGRDGRGGVTPPPQVAWLSLDEGDNVTDPLFVLSCHRPANDQNRLERGELAALRSPGVGRHPFTSASFFRDVLPRVKSNENPTER